MWNLAKYLTVSASMIENIQLWEGYRDKAYKDAAVPPIWTIGFGHTNGVKQGWVCTLEQAKKWFLEDIKDAEAIVKKWITVPITQGMYDALVSFVFNTGPGAKGVKDGLIYLKSGNHSTLYKKIMIEHDFKAAADEFPKWTRAGTAHPKGLVKRRAAERAYFLKDGTTPSVYQFVPIDPPKDFAIESPPATQKQGFWAWLKSLFGVK